MACIQTAANGILAVTAGRMLAATYGFGTTFTSIILGSLILWLIGLAIIAMSRANRFQAVENVRAYLGTAGGFAGACILLLAFVFWIAVQLESSMEALIISMPNVRLPVTDFNVRVGVACGVAVALLATGGIRLIRWICVCSLPFILLSLLLIVLVTGVAPESTGSWLPSLAATTSVVAFTLPGTVNLPTFFRHARSKADAFLALSLLIVLSALINLSTLWIPTDDLLILRSQSIWGRWPLYLMYVGINIVSLFCVNLVNIYFASAGWETLIKTRWKAKEYAIVGLAGTVVYVFFQVQLGTFFVENILTGVLGCMGIALVGAFMVRLVVRHRPRPFEKLLGLITWGTGSVVVVLSSLENPSDPGPPLLKGALTTVLALLVIVLVEETYWAVNQLLRRDVKEHSKSRV